MATQRRILIVDDEADLAWMLKLNLEKTKAYDVQIETDPAQAVETARKFVPDLILLDFVLPKTSGGELAVQIKMALAPKNPPIIFLTAALPQSNPDSKMRTMVGYRFLAKPVGLEHLLACIAAELQHSHQG
ncbi:MAG TPA: response regulator [Verrucomicrobiae bacterium]|nr:response regulator [Verrucomicrobiae bacterium]